MIKQQFSIKKIFLVLSVLLFTSCMHSLDKKEAHFVNKGTKYAQNYSLQKGNNRIELQTKNVWNSDNKSLETYILSDSIQKVTNAFFIQIPIKRAVCMSVSHIAEIALVHQLDKVIAVSGLNYVYNAEIAERRKQQKIIDLPEAQNLDLEKLVSLQPDIIFMYGISPSDLLIAQKIRKIGIPVVFNNDYLEQTPLGRAEWSVFMSAFFGKYKEAAQLFDSISKAYLATKEQLKISLKPKVFLNIPYKDVWYMPGGKSYMAKLISDAGGDYVFSENTASKSLSLDFEYVYNSCNNADIWLNIGTLTHLSDLKKLDARMLNFKAYKSSEIYSPIKRMNAKGANDFWETGIVRPDLILHDLSLIFQKKEGELFFYERLR